MTLRILVLCTGNSCRSQMAEGYLRKFLGARAEVVSAGVVAHGVNPRAIAAMKEDGVDISGHTSKTIDAVMGQQFHHVLTVCDNARETCPWFPGGAQKWHYDFPDPAQAKGTEEQVMQEFAQVRRMIKAYCESFSREVVGK